MKRTLILLAGLAAGTMSAAAFADGPPDHPKFDEAKARHVARLQTELACVQAAGNFEALRACRPPRPEDRPRGGAAPAEQGEQR